MTTPVQLVNGIPECNDVLQNVNHIFHFDILSQIVHKSPVSVLEGQNRDFGRP
jgi:hypothetical protein